MRRIHRDATSLPVTITRRVLGTTIGRLPHRSRPSSPSRVRALTGVGDRPFHAPATASDGDGQSPLRLALTAPYGKGVRCAHAFWTCSGSLRLQAGPCSQPLGGGTGKQGVVCAGVPDAPDYRITVCKELLDPPPPPPTKTLGEADLRRSNATSPFKVTQRRGSLRASNLAVETCGWSGCLSRLGRGFVGPRRCLRNFANLTLAAS